MSVNDEFQNDLCRFYYYDANKSILVNEVYGRWTWYDAYVIIQHGNSLISTMQSPKYVIAYLKGEALLMPSDKKYALSNLRRIMQLDRTDEDLVIFIGVSKFLEALINTVSRIYGFFNQTARYRYAKTFEEALELIEAHKARHTDKIKFS